MKDTMVFPNEGEHWGHFEDGTYNTIPMNQTKWYKNDLFGLKTVDEAGKIFFEVGVNLFFEPQHNRHCHVLTLHLLLSVVLLIDLFYRHLLLLSSWILHYYNT